MNTRKRPLKLHIKDGKESSFLLIGPKGRELMDLVWSGSDLALQAVSADEAAISNDDKQGDSPVSIEESSLEEPPVDEPDTDTDPEQTVLDEKPVEAPPESPDATAPEPTPSEGGMTVAPEVETPHVTGDAETPGADEVIEGALADLPSPEGEPTAGPKDAEEEEKNKKDDVFKIDADIPGNPKPPVAWLTKGKDKIAIMSKDDESDDDAIKRVQAKHSGYDLHKGPEEPESEDDESKDKEASQKDQE